MSENLGQKVSEPVGMKAAAEAKIAAEAGSVAEQGCAGETKTAAEKLTAAGGKNILLVNDLPGYGKVALAAMTPILSRLGHYVFQLPTAVVSNTLDYGKFRIQDMTEFMRDTLVVWKELGFEPECICTGFILSEEQADLIGGYIRQLRQERASRLLVVVDPIMADGGKLYNGIGPERVIAMRRLLVHADVMVPNMTEASFLTEIRPGKETGTSEEIRELVEGLREISGKSVVITSAVMQRNAGDMIHLVCGYDHLRNEYFEIPYDFLPVRIAGSGDIFSAVMTGELLKGKSLEEAAGKAVRALSRLIEENQSHMEEYKGIVVERYWELLGAER